MTRVAAQLRVLPRPAGEALGTPASYDRLLGHVPPVIKLFLLIDLLFVLAYPVNQMLFAGADGFAATFFDLDKESNAPTWWSTSQLLLIGVVLLGFAYHQFDRREPRSWALALAPALFLFLSLDEAAMVHEAVGRMLDGLVHLGDREDSTLRETGVWMFFCAPALLAVVAGLGLTCARFFRGRRHILIRFAVGFGLLVGSAAGIETISNFVGDGFGYQLETLVEEAGELIGETVLLWAALELLASYGITVLSAPPPKGTDAGS